MIRLRLGIVILTLNTLFSCVDRFDFEGSSSVKSIVVDCLITDDKEDHTIRLSYSTLLAAPVWDPVPNADVVVVDKAGNIFEFKETVNSRGIYEGHIGFEYLVPGNAFKISFTSHEGKEYESTFQEILPCPEIDSLYYEVDNEYYGNQDEGMQSGIEFYLDVKANRNFSSHYRWQIDETYEYHATWPIARFWRAEWWNITPDYKYFICYKTEPVYEIISGSTSHLDDNVYLKLPLLFVNNRTQRLYYNYSMLVRQMSITEEAHYYWDAIKKNNQDGGGLYDSQPVKVIGNITCLSDPDESVLGFFGVSSVKTRRITLGKANFRNLIYDYDLSCKSQLIQPENLDFITESDRSEWRIYVAPVPEGEPDGIYYADQSCFDCRLAGGVLEIPDFFVEIEK